MSTIISFHSFRGGTGKTNTAANLAVTMVLRGKRVGIVDTDIQSPGIHVLFGLDEDSIKYTLNDYLWGRCPIEATAYDVSSVLWQGGGQPDEHGRAVCLRLLPSSIKASAIARVLREGYDVDRLNDGYREVINHLSLDYLVIDTHPGLNHETLLSIAVSDVLLIMLRPDQQDIQGTGVTVEVARKLAVPKLLLLVNKVLPELGAHDDIRQQVESTYNAKVARVLPLTEDMVRLASGGLFIQQYPDHPWSQELRALADEIMG